MGFEVPGLKIPAYANTSIHLGALRIRAGHRHHVGKMGEGKMEEQKKMSQAAGKFSRGGTVVMEAEQTDALKTKMGVPPTDDSPKYVRELRPAVFDGGKARARPHEDRTGLSGTLWKLSRIGERMSPYISAGCAVMAVHLLFFR